MYIPNIAPKTSHHKSAVCIFLAILVLFFVCNQKAANLPQYENVNIVEGIGISVKEGTLSPNGLEIKFQNTDNRSDFSYGTAYFLERYKLGQWCEVKPLPGAFIGGPDIDYPLSDGAEMRYYWRETYGDLPQGHYRIIVEINSKPAQPITGQTCSYYLATDFCIK